MEGQGDFGTVELAFGRSYAFSFISNPVNTELSIGFALPGSANATITLSNLRLYYQPGSNELLQWVRGGVSDMIAHTGTRGGVIVIPDENNYMSAQTSLYGTLARYNRYEPDGDLTSGGFLLDESL